jgi:hypothetical protein
MEPLKVVAFTMLMRKERLCLIERLRDGRRSAECIELEMVKLRVQAVMMIPLISSWFMSSSNFFG